MGPCVRRDDSLKRHAYENSYAIALPRKQKREQAALVSPLVLNSVSAIYLAQRIFFSLSRLRSLAGEG